MSTAVRQSYFKPTMENGGYWEYYRDLEKQFEDYLGYVPYLSGNEVTYSFRLANLLLAIGAHIDSAFKEIARYPDFSTKYPEIMCPKTKSGKKREPNIRDYYPISSEYQLPKRKAMFKRLPEREQVIPFENYVKVGNGIDTPKWWQVYNDVKHNLSENLEKANLRNVRDALAGAFLLNIIHTPVYIRLVEQGIVKPKPTGSPIAINVFIVSKEWGEKFKAKGSEAKKIGAVETPLFSYNYAE